MSRNKVFGREWTQEQADNYKAAVVIVLLAFSVVQHRVARVSAESGEYMVHLETMTGCRCQTEYDTILHDDELTGDEYAVSSFRNFDSKPVLVPRVTFTTSLPVSQVGVVNLIPGSTYQWVFPDLPVGQSISPYVWFNGSVVFTPGFSAKRIMTPAVLTYPGGRQTVALTFTPMESEFRRYTSPYLIGFGVEAREDDYVEPTIVHVEWPTTSGPDQLGHASPTDHSVGGTIAAPIIGTTYTLVVTIDIRLKKGIKAVEYKPLIRMDYRLADWHGTHVGIEATAETEVGTWKWETNSEHLWLCWNCLQKTVEFLAYSHTPATVPAIVQTTVARETQDDIRRRFDDIDPDTLNLKSKVKEITTYIELLGAYDLDHIDVGSVAITQIDDNLLASPLRTVGPSEIGDYDGDGIPDLKVKFDGGELLPLLKAGYVKLTVAGTLEGKSLFEGTDTIRVIDKPLRRWVPRPIKR